MRLTIKSQMQKAIRAVDQSKRYNCDEDFADGSNRKGPPALSSAKASASASATA
jgi:hypothetical protein